MYRINGDNYVSLADIIGMAVDFSSDSKRAFFNFEDGYKRKKTSMKPCLLKHAEWGPFLKKPAEIGFELKRDDLPSFARKKARLDSELFISVDDLLEIMHEDNSEENFLFNFFYDFPFVDFRNDLAPYSTAGEEDDGFIVEDHSSVEEYYEPLLKEKAQKRKATDEIPRVDKALDEEVPKNMTGSIMFCYGNVWARALLVGVEIEIDIDDCDDHDDTPFFQHDPDGIVTCEGCDQKFSMFISGKKVPRNISKNSLIKCCERTFGVDQIEYN
jgi:hypothetical protein